MDILLKIATLVGLIFGAYKVLQYRELKQRIQLDIDAHMYPLDSPENVEAFTWDKQGNRVSVPSKPHTHVVEVLLKFTNKGYTRMRLYNIQVGINSMRAQNEAQLNSEDGHLSLTRIFTSGNIVALFEVKGKPIEKTSFYYIEPGIEQTVSYLTMISEPRQVIQIKAEFSLEQERIFPKKKQSSKGLYPHTASRTFKIGQDGSLEK